MFTILSGLGVSTSEFQVSQALWQAGLIRTEPLRFKFLMLTGGTRKGMPPVNPTPAAAARGTLKAEGPHEAATFFFSPSGRAPLANEITPKDYGLPHGGRLQNRVVRKWSTNKR